ncbi:MAG: transcription termination/antitermination protein NusG [Dehalococcoidia bacterium]|jgi:transcriptional antiterminator NusG|nr:transcription termination/antitermination protein NusG [Dehalococcoidia bacterium]MDW8009571.1 transcription termination/antitermination protein NusG [Chloroflexota bacterium]
MARRRRSEEATALERPQAEGEARARKQLEGLTDEEIFDPSRRWYIIHTYSGYEEKVKANLENRIRSLDAGDLIFHVLVPEVDEIEIREGQRRTVQRKLFPGYILVQTIDLNSASTPEERERAERAWFVIRNTPGVTGFVGSGTQPVPLDEKELRNIIRQMRSEEPRVKVSFQVGQSVRIIDGPFQDFIGTVEEINLEKGKVRVLVSFFGRDTPVELDFMQVERL